MFIIYIVIKLIFGFSTQPNCQYRPIVNTKNNTALFNLIRMIKMCYFLFHNSVRNEKIDVGLQEQISGQLFPIYAVKHTKILL